MCVGAPEHRHTQVAVFSFPSFPFTRAHPSYLLTVQTWMVVDVEVQLLPATSLIQSIFFQAQERSASTAATERNSSGFFSDTSRGHRFGINSSSIKPGCCQLYPVRRLRRRQRRLCSPPRHLLLFLLFTNPLSSSPCRKEVKTA